jgi:hypothetical protein
MNRYKRMAFLDWRRAGNPKEPTSAWEGFERTALINLLEYYREHTLKAEAEIDLLNTIIAVDCWEGKK